MKIQMKQTKRGSEDGFVVRRYWIGFTYDLSDTLARHFINKGWAVSTDTTTSSER